MKIAEIITVLEELAPPSLQENYDNVGLLTGNNAWICTGIICTLDVTEAVVLEAKERNCNLIVAHHPIIFGSIKKINGNNYVENTIISAIKNDIAIYACHTNLDNVLQGVNTTIANEIGLQNTTVLASKPNTLCKLYFYVPVAQAENVRTAIFNAGAGNIGNYSCCSFNTTGKGTFKAGPNTNAFVGNIGQMHQEEEVKIEVVLPIWLKNTVINALIKAHPYEEVAYDVINVQNHYNNIGSGLIGNLPQPISETLFLTQLATNFSLKVIKHTQLLNKMIQKVAVCGGSGSFLIENAINAGADIFITSDIKYHEFFNANNKLIVADIGHWESEQYTVHLFVDVLKVKFPTFAVLKSKVKTNPVEYFIAVKE